MRCGHVGKCNSKELPVDVKKFYELRMYSVSYRRTGCYLHKKSRRIMCKLCLPLPFFNSFDLCGKSREDDDNERQILMDLKAEMEVAMKLLEKDIHEKQDTIISLRRQLDDIKLINLEMYKKLQECEGSLSHKTELISKLEAKSQAMSDSIQSLEAKYRECESVRIMSERKRRELDLQAAHQEQQTNGIEEDLKVEREWRVSLQETMQQEREKISQLQHELTQLRLIAQKYATLQEEYYTLKEHCLEQDQTLEELGKKLSDSKLELSELKEQTSRKSDGIWTNDKDATNCRACEKEFNLTRRKHHCRNCGDIFCHSCSDNTMSLPSSAKPVRVCDKCQLELSRRQTVM